MSLSAMPDRSRKRLRDPNQLAAAIVEMATCGTARNDSEPDTSGINLAAVELGRLGGLKGGKARADKILARKRSAIAHKAAQVRYGKN